MNPDAYIVVTPLGNLSIDFPEDGGNTIEGPEAAVAFFEDVVTDTVGPMGITLSLRGLEPVHLTGFLDRPDLGLKIIAPLDAESDEE
jgi:hypothetical protein